MNAIDYTGRDNLEAMRVAHRYNESLLELVRKEARRGDLVVDFGSGIGTFAVALAKEGYRVHCVEPDSLQAAVIREAGLPVAASLHELGLAGTDLIYTFNVLEHIENDAEALRELCSALRPGGLLLVYVPAFPVLFSSMDRKVGHWRRYRRSNLASSLREAGLDVLWTRYADSLGFFAALAYRLLGGGSGDVDPKAVAIYDRWVFPISRFADRGLFRVIGKNVVALARKPGGRTDTRQTHSGSQPL